MIKVLIRQKSQLSSSGSDKINRSQNGHYLHQNVFPVTFTIFQGQTKRNLEVLLMRQIQVINEHLYCFTAMYESIPLLIHIY